jgi:thiamine pyrophosphate-dependent acetolactate synthase large subunit-like protein
MKQRRGAEIIVETLVAAGVKRIYGVVGDSLNCLGDELIDLALTNLIR